MTEEPLVKVKVKVKVKVEMFWVGLAVFEIEKRLLLVSFAAFQDQSSGTIFSFV